MTPPVVRRLLLGATVMTAAAPAFAQAVIVERYRWLAMMAFALVIGAILLATWVSARRVRSATDFYIAGQGISGFQNGWAIAGDYLSAASFLGIAGLISLWGYDGFMYALGWMLAYVSVLLLIAEPCRNLGRFTLADILAYRNDQRAARIGGALSVIVVSCFYLTAQMVGGGVLIKALIGIDYEVSVIAVGALVLAYVLVGGMVATTWVQIVRAIMLMLVSIVLVLMVWSQYGFFGDFFAQVVGDAKVQARVAAILGERAANMNALELGQRFLEPGLLFSAPIDQISLGVALVFGTAGLPHILMRFFTTPTAREARLSVVWAMAIIGGFYLLTLFLGLGAAIGVGHEAIRAVDAGGNLAAPLLAQALGGGPDSLLGNCMLAFVAAVAFATIIAVVASLTLAAASAVAHDLYIGVVRNGQASAQTQLRAARIATLAIGIVAILLGIVAKGQNVAHLVALAFAVAASANFPCLFLTLFWRRCNTGGIVAGMLVGILASIALVLVSPNMTYPQAVKAAARQVLADEPARRARVIVALASPERAVQEAARKDAAMLGHDVARARAAIERYRDQQTSVVGLEAPLISLRNPGLISVPLGFLAVILGSLFYRDQRAEAKWDELRVRLLTGIAAPRESRR